MIPFDQFHLVEVPFFHLFFFFFSIAKKNEIVFIFLLFPLFPSPLNVAVSKIEINRRLAIQAFLN